jgi:predicted amidohydrolase YtcJ
MLALTNGRIFAGGAWATGLVIADEGRVVAVLRSGAPGVGAPTRSLQGRVVVPGFIDAHLHLSHMAEARRGLPIQGSESPGELLAMVAHRAAELPAGSWILGTGFDDTRWPPGALDRWTLDRAGRDHPVFLQRKDLHSGVASSLALQQAGIADSMPDPVGGRFERDPRGRLTGVVKERAGEALQRVVPGLHGAELEAALESSCRDLLRLGVTTACSIGNEAEFSALQRLERQGRLPIRVCQYLGVDHLEAVLAEGLRSGTGSGRRWFGGIKLFADGSLGSRTAWLEAPYENTNDCGVAVTESADLSHAVGRARTGGLAVAIHAIGDRALRVALDAIQSQPSRPRADGFADRIEHVQLGSVPLFRRMQQLDVIASMQPAHAPADRVLAERWWGARCRYAYAWRSVLDAGVTLAFGSDAPVEPPDPLTGVRAATTRLDAGGEPAGGWYPEERVSLEQALHAYGPGAAQAVGRANTVGSLSVGQWADLVVIDGDLGAATAKAAEVYLAGRPVTAA